MYTLTQLCGGRTCTYVLYLATEALRTSLGTSERSKQDVFDVFEFQGTPCRTVSSIRCYYCTNIVTTIYALPTYNYSFVNLAEN
jgi:hypothetical protein